MLALPTLNMDAARKHENVIQLPTADADRLSAHVRDQLALANHEDRIDCELIACRGDEVAGPLAYDADAIAAGREIPLEDLPEAHLQLIRRASRGSVALRVLEDCTSDDRFKGKPVYLTGYAELIDVEVRDVIDHEGCRWPISPVVDQFTVSNFRWRQVTSVSPTAEATTSGRVCMCLRSVAATVYAALSAGEPQRNSFFSLAVLLAKTSIATAPALAVTAAYPKNSFIVGDARLNLPCGSILVIRAVNEGERNVNEVIIFAGSEKLSALAKYTVNVLACVLLGSGIQASSQVEDTDDEFSLTWDISRMLYIPAAVTCRLDVEGVERDFSVFELVRALIIYGLATGATVNNTGVDPDRVLLAREEVKELIQALDGWDLSDYLEEVALDLEPSHSTSESAGLDRTEFLHFGPGTSDLPILEHDLRTEDGLQVCARRGIPIKPDSRRSVVIRKRKMLWGRATFENSCFFWRPLVNHSALLRAVVPFRSISVVGIQFEQFEASTDISKPGNEIANILLSGAYGADAALWALKKILYSGRGLKPGFVPGYLQCMRERLQEDGFAVVSVLGNCAVQGLEVSVDTKGRVILDYEGDFKPLVIQANGRRLRCVDLSEEDYNAKGVGTLNTAACI